MYSSSSLPNLLLWVPFLAMMAIQLLFICKVSSLNLTNTYLHHKCLISEGEYKAGSDYEKMLTNFIRSETQANFRQGFMLTSRKNLNDTVTVTLMYQCRGDSYWSKCRPCFIAAAAGFRRRCPRNKGGIIWFDQCFLEISKIDISGFRNEIDYRNTFSLHNPKKVTGDAKLFNRETVALLEKLTLKAIDKNNEEDGQIALYASGEKMLGTKKLYAVVQCTRILDIPKCKVCLETIIKEFPKCCDGKQGGRALMGTSCNFRYEFYPFLRTNLTTH